MVEEFFSDLRSVKRRKQSTVQGLSASLCSSAATGYDG
jgi:hypothetical protein